MWESNFRSNERATSVALLQPTEPAPPFTKTLGVSTATTP